MGVTLADVFRQHAAEYTTRYGSRMLPSHHRAIRSIISCRTEIMGGHVYHCPDCGETIYHYHSCRNRHCPKCQHGATQKWLESQQDLLLPVSYFMLTFTLPEGFRRFARSHQQVIYNLLFRASAAATKKLSKDPRLIGGKIGMLGILHTWGRKLVYHPHVHYLVPAGGIDQDGKWLPVQKNYFLPTKALAKIFRVKFRDGLKKVDCFDEIPAQVWKQEWVVHCKAVGNGSAVLKYLAPYVFRVAISNKRIVKMENGKVTFLYKDTNTGKTKACQLPAWEFIHRFLQHVLPKGFVKVRYYGFFSPSYRPNLKQLRSQLAQQTDQLHDKLEVETTRTEYLVCCPVCSKPMVCSPLEPLHLRGPPPRFVERQMLAPVLAG